MSQHKSCWGYLYTNLTKDKTKKKVKIHRIVAEAFIPNPLKLPEVNHINGDKSDNRACNLEWVTRRENIAHAYKTGLMKSKRKLSKEDVSVVKELRNRDKLKLKDIAKLFNVSIPCISFILNNKTYLREY
jgi:hypothetical protein